MAVVNRQDAKAAKSAKDFFEPSTVLDDLAYAVIGAAIEVHRWLGPGYFESVYEDALAYELELRGLSFQRQVPFILEYKGRTVGKGRIDLLISNELIVELKSVEQIAPVHRGQVITYLKGTGKHLGLLINFNVAVLKLGIHRIIATP